MRCVVHPPPGVPLVQGALSIQKIKHKASFVFLRFFGSPGFIKINIFMCFRAPQAEKLPERRLKKKLPEKPTKTPQNKIGRS
jgi:hypothetical protein